MQIVNRAAFIFAFSICGIIVFALVIASSYGLENYGMVAAFENDEAHFVRQMLIHINRGSVDPGEFFYYGQMFDLLAYAVVRLLQFLHFRSDVQFIGMTLRLLCLVYGLVALYLLFRLSEFVGVERPFSIGVPLLLLTMPEFMLWSNTIHPDTLQMSFMIAAIFCAFRAPDAKHAYWGGLFAGLAFGTKYGGLVVLPLVLAPMWIAAIARREQFGRLIVPSFLVVAIFVAAYAATNPYALANLDLVKKHLAYLRDFEARGGDYETLLGRDYWLVLVRGEFGRFGMLLFAGGFVLVIVQLIQQFIRRGWRDALTDVQVRSKSLLSGYVLGLAVLLVTFVKYKSSRYSFPFLPFAALLVMWGISDFSRGLNLSQRVRPVATGLAAAVFALFVSIQTVKALGRSVGTHVAKKESGLVLAGAFMSENYPASTIILSDPYSYIPTKFSRGSNTLWGIDMAMADRIKADIVVYNYSGSGRYVWKEKGTTFAMARFKIDPYYGTGPNDKPAVTEAALRSFLAENSGWRLVYENDVVVIFQRSR